MFRFLSFCELPRSVLYISYSGEREAIPESTALLLRYTENLLNPTCRFGGMVQRDPESSSGAGERDDESPEPRDLDAIFEEYSRDISLPSEQITSDLLAASGGGPAGTGPSYGDATLLSTGLPTESESLHGDTVTPTVTATFAGGPAEEGLLYNGLVPAVAIPMQMLTGSPMEVGSSHGEFASAVAVPMFIDGQTAVTLPFAQPFVRANSLPARVIQRTKRPRDESAGVDVVDSSLAADIKYSHSIVPCENCDQVITNVFVDAGHVCESMYAAIRLTAQLTRCSHQRIRAAVGRIKMAKEGERVYKHHRVSGKDVIQSLTEDTLGKISALFHEVVRLNMYATTKSFKRFVMNHEIMEGVLPPVSIRTFHRIMCQAGLAYIKVGVNKARLVLREDIARWRREKFFPALSRYREEGFEILWGDETWLNVRNAPAFAWQNKAVLENPHLLLDDPSLSAGPKEPGKGARIAIFDLLSETRGMVENTLEIFKCSAGPRDPHATMDAEKFCDIMRCKVFENPHVRDKTIVVLDCAPYHTAKPACDKVPLQARKHIMQQWLEDNDYATEQNATRNELYEKLKAIAAERRKDHSHSRSLLVAMAAAYQSGKANSKRKDVRTLFMPPYHPFLNPIEIWWANMKHDARIAIAMEEKRSIEMLRDRVTDIRRAALDDTTPILNTIAHTRKVENIWRERDAKYGTASIDIDASDDAGDYVPMPLQFDSEEDIDDDTD